MIETVEVDEQNRTPDAQGARRMRRLRAIARLLVGLAITTGVWWGIWQLTTSGGMDRSAISQMVMPTAILALIVLVAVRQEQRWQSPLRTTIDRLQQIHQGQLPIESLADITGGLKSLAPVLDEILRDWKQQKLQIAKLNHEMSQRVATRTDALERQIGTLRAQATRDALTGLYNRRLLEAYLPKAIEKALTDRQDLALLMIDVDYFKQLNDTLGHAAGDDMLRDIANLIRSTIRQTDAAFRVGGDEFVVTLPGCSEPAAQALANRLSSLVDQLARTMKISQPPGLSVGVAMLSSVENATPESFLEAADKVLYEVKLAGKKERAQRLAKAS